MTAENSGDRIQNSEIVVVPCLRRFLEPGWIWGDHNLSDGRQKLMYQVEQWMYTAPSQTWCVFVGDEIHGVGGIRTDECGRRWGWMWASESLKAQPTALGLIVRRVMKKCVKAMGVKQLWANVTVGYDLPLDQMCTKHDLTTWKNPYRWLEKIGFQLYGLFKHSQREKRDDDFVILERAFS